MTIVPRKVESSTRWQIVQAFASALSGITKAAGYNTSPMVTHDARKYRKATEKFLVLVEEGNESSVDARNQELEITVAGAIKPEADDPVRYRNMLLQDVRTAIMGDRAALAAVIGTGAAITIGRCDTDQGLLLDSGWTEFEQTFFVKYPQGAVW